MAATNDNAADKALLPAGMSDVLPPDAAFEASVVERLMAWFGSHGYERVKPPLLEFEENLLRGPGEAMAAQTFRLMDPVSQRMMGLRADMTPQVARIATSRLHKRPRPLRLGYAGQVLRVKGTQLRGARQFGQVGVELIGVETPAADAEVILMAAGALAALGLRAMSVDLCLPTLVPAVADDLGLDDRARAHLRVVLDRKDAAGIADMKGAIGEDAAALLGALLAATGPVEDALATLAELEFGPAARAEVDRLAAVVAAVRTEAPDLTLTADLVENRGWEYHSGVTFTFFARGMRGELGAGGRYLTGDDTSPNGIEPSTGLTLFMDTLLRALPESERPHRVYVPADTANAAGVAAGLRDGGWVTVRGLGPVGDARAEAQRLGCDHVLEGGRPVPLGAQDDTTGGKD